MRVARWTRDTVEVRAIGAVGALGPTFAIGLAFVGSGSIDALAPTLLFVGLIGGLAGAIGAPTTLRPRRRPMRGSLAFAAAVLVLWGAVGVIGAFIGLGAGAGVVETLGGLVMRVVLIAAYGMLALMPLWILGTIWVVATWFFDGLLRDQRPGAPAA